MEVRFFCSFVTTLKHDLLNLGGCLFLAGDSLAGPHPIKVNSTCDNTFEDMAQLWTLDPYYSLPKDPN